MTMKSKIGAAICLIALTQLTAGCGPKAPPVFDGTGFLPDTVYRIDADPERGFHSAYFLLVPESTLTVMKRDAVPIAVFPNNTGTTSDSIERHEKSAFGRLKRNKKPAELMKTVVLVPGFPRPKAHRKIYTHALDRDTMTTEIPELSRPDLQLVAMIDDAREKLHAIGLQTRSKVIMVGFSAAGMFVNRFTMLHPNRVQVALIGSPGGWPMVPASEYGGEKLPYPIGIDDFEAVTGKNFDKDVFCAVPKFIYIGGEDDNDSVPYDDSYDPPHADLVIRLFGNTPVERWDDAEALYRREGCAATFRLYPGVGHETTMETLRDLVEFTQEALTNAGF